MEIERYQALKLMLEDLEKQRTELITELAKGEQKRRDLQDAMGWSRWIVKLAKNTGKGSGYLQIDEKYPVGFLTQIDATLYAQEFLNHNYKDRWLWINNQPKLAVKIDEKGNIIEVAPNKYIELARIERIILPEYEDMV